MSIPPRRLTFAQREGIEPIPSQLRRTELSKPLRSALWAYVYTPFPDYTDLAGGIGPWPRILYDLHVEHQHLRADKFEAAGLADRVGRMFEIGTYDKVYGWLEYVIQHRLAPRGFADGIQRILEEHQAAYRIVDNAFFPLGSEEEHQNILRATVALAESQFSGARAHLRNAASQLTQGNFAASVRESISAVESVARVLEPTGELSKALMALEAKDRLHGALKKGFLALYGYTSDAQGIRHALLQEAEADVDETDALFFLGACAAFVTYLINKQRA